MKLTIGSLFAGIGGIELGLEQTRGFITKWQVENNPFCLEVLGKHWPDAKRWETIEGFPPEPLNAWRCDIITGGFPCQPVSVAGKQKGDTDERWLWKEMHRVCKVLRPRWVLAENVRGLLSADAGRLFGCVIRDLASLGYCVEWRCVQAAEVGAPHIRERLFIVAYPARQGLDGDFCILGRENRQGPCVCPWWSSEPELDRVADGIPARIYQPRLKTLGNAVVPQVAKWIGKRILEYEQWLKKTSGENGTPNTFRQSQN